MLAYEKDYGGHHGYSIADIDGTLGRSEHGVVMSGSPNLAFQTKSNRPETTPG